MAARHLRECGFPFLLLASALALHLALQPRHVAAAFVRLAQLSLELQQTAADAALGAEAELREVGAEGGDASSARLRFVDFCGCAPGTHNGGEGGGGERGSLEEARDR